MSQSQRGAFALPGLPWIGLGRKPRPRASGAGRGLRRGGGGAAGRSGGRGGRGGGAAGPGGQGVFTSRAILLFLVLFVLAATGVYPLRQYVAQQARIERLQAKQAALQAANARLAYERDRLNDPAYVDQLASQDFHMVKPGEEPWLLTGTPPAGKVAAAPAKPAHDPPWYQRAWRWLRGRSS
jgi:cell division protein FtsB